MGEQKITIEKDAEIFMEKKRAILCIGITFLLNALIMLPIYLMQTDDASTNPSTALMLSAFLFMWFPAIAAIITKNITKDTFKVKIRPHIRKNMKYYVQACFLPGVLTYAGAIVFFILFPHTFDLTWSYANYLMPTGALFAPFTLTISIVLTLGLLIAFLAPLVIINHFFAFGEEYGWRGYILPKLQTFMSDRKAIIISGILWGLGHTPLVYFGLIYGFEYPGFPYMGIFMITILATVVGVWLSYLTIQTKSIVAASLAHGAFNTIREIPLFVAVLGVSPFLGPRPSGIIGMIGFIILAVICLYKMKK